MKIKIFGGIAVLAIALVVSFNVNLNLNLNKSNNHASLLALDSVEALAVGESVICTSSSMNNGVCKTKIDGSGAVCVTPGIFDTLNCVWDDYL